MVSDVKVKVKFTLEQTTKVQRGVELYSFLNRGARWRGWLLPRPGRSLLRERPITHCIGAPWPVWTGAENLAPPGFDPRTVQLVASRYTVWAIPAHDLWRS
jgi:hypothetical protein